MTNTKFTPVRPTLLERVEGEADRLETEGCGRMSDGDMRNLLREVAAELRDPKRSAAPDLYAACEAIATSYDSDGNTKRQKAAHAAVDAALRKARGER